MTTLEPRTTLQSTFVVDCDIHVNDAPDLLAPFCDPPWRRALENMGHATDKYLHIPGYNKIPEEATPTMAPKFPGGFPSRKVETPDQMVRELRQLDIDAGIIFPDNLLTIAQLPQTDYAVALARAYNRWLVDYWLDRGTGLYGAIIAPSQDPVAAAAEVRKYASVQEVVAVFLPTSAVYPLWGDRRYDPIFEACQEASLPVMLHSVSAVHPHFPFNVEQFDTVLARHTVSHTFSIMANFVSMMTTGVPARFPSLDVVFTEAGISWVPFMQWRLDKEYNESRRELPFYADRPSTYTQHMYYATQPIEEPKRRKDLVDLMNLFDGEDRVVFASDWPHHDFDHPRQVFDLPMSREAKAKVMGGNAAKLFGIEQKVADA